MDYWKSKRIKRSQVTKPSRLLQFLNQPITLFLFGTVAVGVFGSFITERRQCLASSTSTIDAFRRVTSELIFRTNYAINELDQISAENEAAQRIARADRLVLLRSPRGPHLYREFAGERYEALLYRQRELAQDLELRPSANSVQSIKYMDERAVASPDEFGPLPTYRDIDPPGPNPYARITPVAARSIRTLHTTMLLYRSGRSAFLRRVSDADLGPGGPHQLVLGWMVMLNNGELRVAGGCGFRAVARRLLGIQRRRPIDDDDYWTWRREPR